MVWSFLFFVCFVWCSTSQAAPTPVRLQCNQTLTAGSTLALTDKLDLSGRQPDQPQSIQSPCGIYGPEGNGGDPATILVPANDCVLLAQGLVTITGNIRFVVGNKTRQFDCCDDGEGHGSILCSYTNLTIAQGANVKVETTDGDDSVIINPGGFWTGNFIHVLGTVNASLKAGQMTGVNGLLSSTGVRVSSTGRVIATGMASVRGAAIQGGDDGTVLNGSVTCRNYSAGDAGGCIAAGQYFSLGPAGTVHASDGMGINGASGLVAATDNMSIQGTIVAERLNTSDAGAVLAGNDITMSEQSSIVADDVYSSGGPTVVTSSNVTLKDSASITVSNSLGVADGGAVQASLVRMFDDSKISCENGYADNGGACILSSIEMDDRASITARNMTAGSNGGALSGGYPNMYLVVRGSASIDLVDSHAGLYGGAMFFWENISFVGDSFKVRIRNSAAPCGGAIVSIGQQGIAGDGNVYLNPSGMLHIENAKELNASKGCITIQANLISNTGNRIPQPCGSGCAIPSVKASCGCKPQQKFKFMECCAA